MAQRIEDDGHLQHFWAEFNVSMKYGQQCTYREPICNRFGLPARDRHGRRQYRQLLHPDILCAFKKLTGNSVIWEKHCRGWRKRKSSVS
jgi:hypothetical protein